MGRRAGAPGALPLADAVAQSRNPAVADIIGARRARTAAMISSGSSLEVDRRRAEVGVASWRWMMLSGTPSPASSSACACRG